MDDTPPTEGRGNSFHFICSKMKTTPSELKREQFNLDLTVKSQWSKWDLLSWSLFNLIIYCHSPVISNFFYYHGSNLCLVILRRLFYYPESPTPCTHPYQEDPPDEDHLLPDQNQPSTCHECSQCFKEHKTQKNKIR